MNHRIPQLDFLKGVCIVLMVIFHLVFIGDKYPYAKDIVYTFHMPVFLLISGYLSHTQRTAKNFFRAQWWIFVPYFALELPYIIFSGMMGVRGGDTDMSFPHLAYRIFLDPLGPYWYLHTLIICNISLWCVQKFFCRLNDLFRLFLFALLLVGLVFGTHIVSDNVLYYFLGAVIAQTGVSFLQIFHPSLIALFLGGLLCCYPKNLHYNTPGGIAITYLVINFLIWVHGHLNEKMLKPTLFVGRNTLPILLFSPIFTMAVKPLVPILSFDPTGIIFLFISTTFAIIGSLSIAWMMDKFKLSRWFCGRLTLLCH